MGSDDPTKQKVEIWFLDIGSIGICIPVLFETELLSRETAYCTNSAAIVCYCFLCHTFHMPNMKSNSWAKQRETEILIPINLSRISCSSMDSELY